MATAVTKETLGFQAEVKQLLHLMIHALYSNKEIFLRELLSNASDAADKLKFEALQNPSLLEGETELKVWVSIDKEAKTLTIRDNGIGMSREEIIQNLGTIAKSGTKEFLSRLTGDAAQDANLIGQFGVGFYSSFIVADKVVVTTRRAGSAKEEGVRWSSKGEGEYELESLTYLPKGTEVVLHLKKEEEEFLNDWRLKHIIKKYSDHLTLPILMKNEKGEEETVNQATALWTLPKAEITEAQYKEFYKHIAHDFTEPLLWSHYKVEGKLEYTALLYIPSKAPFDLFSREKTRGLKLYVKRVFIMEDVEQFLPHYLRFVKGIMDCNDLPLNISREILQNHRMVDTIKTALTKRILGMLEELAGTQEKYQSFWQEFGQVLKEGLVEDFNHQEQLSKLLRFSTTYMEEEKQTVSLEEYLTRMPEGQDKIYYITAQSFNAAKESPHLEIFRKKGIEVLLLTDRIDEWLITHLTSFKEKSLQSITQSNLELDKLTDEQTKEAFKEKEQDFAEVLKKAKEALKEAVKEVRLSQRLTDSPACMVREEEGFNLQMEKLMKSSGQAIPPRKPILELNPSHIIIEQLKNKEETEFADWMQVLFAQAILAEGEQLEEPAHFVKRLNKLLALGKI